jgi:hypothetical protein
MFEALEARRDASLRELVEVLVLPLVAKLDDPDGGTAYVRVMAQLIASPAHAFLDPAARRASAGGDRLMRAISGQLSDLSRAVQRMRTLLVVSLLFHGLADFARLREAKLVAATHRKIFVASLVDGLVGILDAEEPE